MRRRVLFFIVLAVGVTAGSVLAETYMFTPAINKHRLKVVRKYHILVMPNQVNVAEIPAMLSFTGATNEQAIESSVFTFSVPPDKTEVKCRDYGQWSRKAYRLTWNKPAAITMAVTQEMTVTLTARNRLCTEAKLPYPAGVRGKFEKYLGKGNDGDINPDNSAAATVCKEILARSQYAEQAASGVCDWVADNLERRKGEGWGVDKTLEVRYGNSYSLSCVACSMLRKMGIPCDVGAGMYVGGNGYFFIEVYFPDAGWVFYDVASPTRGFMTLDCAATASENYCIQSDPKKDFEWVDGYFFDSRDIGKYVEPEAVTKKALRDTPAKKEAMSVMVMHSPVPAGLPVRQEPLRNLMLDPNTLPPPVVEKKAQAGKDAEAETEKPKDEVRKGKE
jgi:hypothetical protein